MDTAVAAEKLQCSSISHSQYSEWTGGAQYNRTSNLVHGSCQVSNRFDDTRLSNRFYAPLNAYKIASTAVLTSITMESQA